MIRNSHLVDAQFQARHFCYDLWLEAEAAFFNRDALDNFSAEGFETGLHVGEVQIRTHVGEQREEAVANGMPEVEDTVCLRADEAGAKNDICAVFQDRLEYNRVFRRVVFEIGILDDNDGSGGMGDTGAKRGTLALVGVVAEGLQGGSPPGTKSGMWNVRRGLGLSKLLEDSPSAISRSIVNDDELRDMWLSQNFADNSLDG